MSAALPTLGIMMRSSLSEACSTRSTTSRYQYGLSSPLMRTETVFLPQSTPPMASTMFFRACGLSSGATESSRSRFTTSASEAAIFSKIEAREPGPKSWQRFGRATGCGWMRKLMGVPREILFRLSRSTG
jgi:hypothetical protein